MDEMDQSDPVLESVWYDVIYSEDIGQTVSNQLSDPFYVLSFALDRECDPFRMAMLFPAYFKGVLMVYTFFQI